MMEMTPRLILAYLHHAKAITAVEQLEAAETQALPYMKPEGRRRTLERQRRLASGLPPLSEAEERAQKQAGWDAAWARLRGQLGVTGAPQVGSLRLAPGERIVLPDR